MSKYKISDREIDFSRGEVLYGGKAKAIEPKVLAVLKLLVEAKGNVLSQEIIFSEVWPKSIFSQSYIQRCIAVLRKLLGDDAKKQSVIVTHPKIGYSINYETVKVLETNHQSKKYHMSSAAFIVLFVFAAVLIFTTNDKNQAPIRVVESKQINASEEREFQPFLLSERYLSFVREEKNRGQAIWLADLVSQSEKRITRYLEKIPTYHWANASTLLVSEIDGNEVKIFRQLIDESGPIKSNPLGKSNVIIASLSNIEVFRHFVLTANNHIIYLATFDDGLTELRSLDLVTGHELSLLKQTGYFKPYGFTFNKLTRKIALVGFNESKVTEVKLLDTESEKLERIATLDSDIYHLSWNYQHRELLLSQGRHFKSLSLNGEVSNIPYSTTAFIQGAVSSESGDRIAFTQMETDSDLWITDKSNNLHNAYNIVNSTASDFGGSFSPSGERIAYISNRLGFPQLYVTNVSTGETEVIFENPDRKLLLSLPFWHPNKDIIVSSVGEKLLLIDLDNLANQIRIFEGTSLSPLDWYKKENALLVNDLIDNKTVLSKFYIDSSLIIPIEEHNSTAALIGPQDSLIKINHDGIIEQKGDQITEQKILFGNIENVISANDGLYLQTNNSGVKNLMFYSFLAKTIEENKELPSEVFVVWDVHPFDQRLLFEENKSNQDIVLLELE